MRRITLFLALGLVLLAAAPAPHAEAAVGFLRGERLRCPNATTRLCGAGSRTEPLVQVDPATGNAYLSDQNGVPAGVNVWVRKPGEKFSFAGKADEIPAVTARTSYALGGGDSAMTIDPAGTLYVASLYLGANTLAVSGDHGASFERNYVAGKPNIDRQWLASYGPGTIYMSGWDGTTGNARTVWVSKSVDGGRTWLQHTPVTTLPGLTGGFTTVGTLAVDRNDGTIYQLYVRGQNLTLARSRDGGLRFETIVIHQAAVGTDGPQRFNLLPFPVVAVDRAGNVFVVAGDQKDIWLFRSTDAGSTWSAPVRVNDPSVSASAVFPWITAGSAGRIGVVWLGSPEADPEKPAPWNAYYAQSVDALSATPTFERARASDDPVHNNGICMRGLACDTGVFQIEPVEEIEEALEPTIGPLEQIVEPFEKIIESVAQSDRDLAEVVTVAIDADGRAIVAYPDDFEGGADVPTLTVVAKQGVGETLYAPGDYPNPAFEPR